jgi:hypothetical protein
MARKDKMLGCRMVAIVLASCTQRPQTKGLQGDWQWSVQHEQVEALVAAAALVNHFNSSGYSGRALWPASRRL